MFFSRSVKFQQKCSNIALIALNVEIRYSVELFSFQENARLSRKFVGTDIFQCHCSHMQSFAVSYTNNAHNLFGKTFFDTIAAKCNSSLSTKKLWGYAQLKNQELMFSICVSTYLYLYLYLYVCMCESIRRLRRRSNNDQFTGPLVERKKPIPKRARPTGPTMCWRRNENNGGAIILVRTRSLGQSLLTWSFETKMELF